MLEKDHCSNNFPDWAYHLVKEDSRFGQSESGQEVKWCSQRARISSCCSQSSFCIISSSTLAISARSLLLRMGASMPLLARHNSGSHVRSIDKQHWDVEKASSSSSSWSPWHHSTCILWAILNINTEKNAFVSVIISLLVHGKIFFRWLRKKDFHGV